MAMGQHTSKCSYTNKKGIVLSLDAAIAIAISMLILSSASFYLSNLEDEPLAKASMYSQMQDVAAVIDYNRILATMNNTTISNNLSYLVSGEFSSQIEIFWQNTNAGNLEYNTTSESHNETTDRALIAGERLTLINNTPALVRYWIWQK